MSPSRQAIAIQRTLTLLATLGDQGEAGCSFTALRSALGCGDASLSRLLANVQDLGLIRLSDTYRLSPAATAIAGRILGQADPEPRLRAALARLSDVLRSSVAIFDVVPTGVRCRLRHLRPDGVGFIAENSVREQLYGHGVAVVAAAHDVQARDWHGAALRQYLRQNLGQTVSEWRHLLSHIRAQGWYAPHGVEGAIHDGAVDPTIVRLAIPICAEGRLLGVFCASGHGLSRESVFTDGGIAQAQELVVLLAEDFQLWHGWN